MRAASSCHTPEAPALSSVLVGDADSMTVDELFSFLDTADTKQSSANTHYYSRGSCQTGAFSRDSLGSSSEEEEPTGTTPCSDADEANDEPDEPSPEEENKENQLSPAAPSEFPPVIHLHEPRHFRDITLDIVCPREAQEARFMELHRRHVERSTHQYA